MKRQSEMVGVAPAAALLLAAMMMASLMAMNLTAERALSRNFAPDPLAVLTKSISLGGVSLRQAVLQALPVVTKGGGVVAARPAPSVIEVSNAQAGAQAVSSPPAVPAPVAGPAVPPTLSTGRQASNKHAKKKEGLSGKHASAAGLQVEKRSDGNGGDQHHKNHKNHG